MIKTITEFCAVTSSLPSYVVLVKCASKRSRLNEAAHGEPAYRAVAKGVAVLPDVLPVRFFE
jgi:hypothetical protein